MNARQKKKHRKQALANGTILDVSDRRNITVIEPSGSKDWKVELLCTGYGNGNDGCGIRYLATEDMFTASKYNSYCSCKCPNCGKLTNILSDSIPCQLRARILLFS